MKANPGLINGYAIQNTTYVLCALRAYERIVESKGRIEATEAAINCYESLAQKRVTDRCIRKWIFAVKRYGGIEKTPENAFGARKSCPHLRRPIKERLRQIRKESAELAVRIKKQNQVDSALLTELVLIDRELTDCLHRVLDNKPTGHLASIGMVARRLEVMPIHRLCKNVSALDTESVLEELLARLKISAVNQPRKVTEACA